MSSEKAPLSQRRPPSEARLRAALPWRGRPHPAAGTRALGSAQTGRAKLCQGGRGAVPKTGATGCGGVPAGPGVATPGGKARPAGPDPPRCVTIPQGAHFSSARRREAAKCSPSRQRSTFCGRAEPGLPQGISFGGPFSQAFERRSNGSGPLLSCCRRRRGSPARAFGRALNPARPVFRAWKAAHRCVSLGPPAHGTAGPVTTRPHRAGPRSSPGALWAKRASWMTASLGCAAPGSGSRGAGDPSLDRLSGVWAPLE